MNVVVNAVIAEDKIMTNIFYGKSIEGKLVFDNNKSIDDYLFSVDKKKLVIKIDKEKGIRTPKQNDSLHLFFELLAKEFNDAGYSVQLVLKEKIDLMWDKDMIKELLWRPAQIAITKKSSTTSLDKGSEIDIIYEHLNRHIGEKFGIHVPFPHEDKTIKTTDFHKGLDVPEGEVQF